MGAFQSINCVISLAGATITKTTKQISKCGGFPIVIDLFNLQPETRVTSLASA